MEELRYLMMKIRMAPNEKIKNQSPVNDHSAVKRGYTPNPLKLLFLLIANTVFSIIMITVYNVIISFFLATAGNQQMKNYLFYQNTLYPSSMPKINLADRNIPFLQEITEVKIPISPDETVSHNFKGNNNKEKV